MKWIEYAWRCDQCLEVVRSPAGGLDGWELGDKPPDPWREFQLPGWAGRFACCSEECQNDLTDRHIRPLPIPAEIGIVEKRIAVSVQLLTTILSLLEDLSAQGVNMAEPGDNVTRALRSTLGRAQR